jgi:hypothetical protein
MNSVYVLNSKFAYSDWSDVHWYQKLKRGRGA